MILSNIYEILLYARSVPGHVNIGRYASTHCTLTYQHNETYRNTHVNNITLLFVADFLPNSRLI